MTEIRIDEIVIPEHQRETIAPHVAEIAKRMKKNGYNYAYPITLNDAGELVDGGHRIEAAKQVGITQVPYVLKPEGISDVMHAINCNADGATTKTYDVFDYAYHCWTRVQAGWLGKMIADELGWSPELVSKYKLIRERLCLQAWNLARCTTNCDFVQDNKEGIVQSDCTIVQWSESHFRALLKYLPYDFDNPDEVIARRQTNTIQQILDGFMGKLTDDQGDIIKVTARWVAVIAKEQAWYALLEKTARKNVPNSASPEDIESLVAQIDRGEYGYKQDTKELQHIKDISKVLAARIPRLFVGCTENMDFLDAESVDVIITSPPYNMGEDNWPMGGQGRTPRENGIGYIDNLPEDKYRAWQLECLYEMYRVAKPGASLFYNHKTRVVGGKTIHPMEWLGANENPWILRQELIWDRGSTHNHNQYLFWPYDERVYWFTKGKPTLPDKPIGIPTIWKFHGPIANTWHPAPFSPEIPRLCLTAVGRPGITILDPFAGSCTTLRVALKEFGYDAIGVDINKEYLDRVIQEEQTWTIENAS